MKIAKSMRILGAGVMTFSVASVGITTAASAECYEKAPLRPVHRTFVRRDIEESGVYAVTRRPSLYGNYARRVVEPGHVVWHEHQSTYRTVTKQVRISGGWSWEKRLVKGREIMCRVRRPDRYETVEKRVLVSRGRRWAERAPASVSYVHERVLLRPYRNVVHYQRPYIRNYRETLRIQPEGYRWLPSSLRPDC